MTDLPTTASQPQVSDIASDHRRYWWHRLHTYEPDVYRVLSDSQRQLLIDWYAQSEADGRVGEMAVPMTSAILGFVNGSGIRRVVQLGHFAGYSCLLLGWALQRMGVEHGLFSIDLRQKHTDATRHWTDRAGLDAVLDLHTSDSTEAACVPAAREYLKGDPQAVIIDSSHQYAHTLRELDLWYPALAPGGLVFLHDATPMAARYDRSEQGGVRRAIDEWLARPGAPTALTLAGPPDHDQTAPYADPSGLCVIQKPGA